MKVIVIAPHPDDEVLGVGGTLLRLKAEGAIVAWLIMSTVSGKDGWGEREVEKRASEIKNIAKFFNFDSVFELGLPSAALDQVSMGDLVSKISEIFKEFQPDDVFVPHFSDIHSDHRIVFDAVASCSKWFRHPSIKRVLAYETISETDFGLIPSHGFRPNYFVNIEAHLDSKLAAMDIYNSELGDFPFPRSHKAIRALATIRGATSGFKAAEAFELLRERL